jgi:hypothetical protein
MKKDKEQIKNNIPLDTVSYVSSDLDAVGFRTARQTLITADINDAKYSNVDYIGSPDANIWNDLRSQTKHSKHEGSSPFNNLCLGCLCNGGSRGNSNYSFKDTYNFSSGGKLYLKTKGNGQQMCQIPAEGGKVIFEARGNSATLILVGKGIEKKNLEQENYKNPISFAVYSGITTAVILRAL